MKRALAVVLWTAAALTAGAAPPGLPPAHVSISRAAGPITIDGSLVDPGWKGAAEIHTFFELSPGDNPPPKVRTTAFVTYDDTSFYVAIRCDDPRPREIRAQYVERDHVASDQDFAGIMLDTKNDGRTALELFVNPYGIQDDFVRDESVVSGSNEDASPDFHWDSAARITATGWQLEMRVPFSTLRYGKGDPLTWGLVVFRNWPRDFRYQIASNPAPRDSSCFICHESKIEGLTGLPRAGHVVLAPYGTLTESGVPRDGPGSVYRNDPIRGSGGLDLKWTPSGNTTFDATLNPDFSQIESDVAQISANNRFALFYPEKRPFFMEQSQLFNSPIQAIYSRTITSPRWGARATGEADGNAWTALVAEDRGGGTAVIPGPSASTSADEDSAALVAIGRVQHAFEGRSFAGFLVTDREVEGGSHNRVFGPDFQWTPSDQDQIAGQFLISSTETPNRPDLSPDWNGRSFTAHALNLTWNHSGTHWNYSAAYRDLADGFRADLGYVPQVGIREAVASVSYVFYTLGFLSRVNPFLLGDEVTDTSGHAVTSIVEPGISVQGKAGLSAELDYNAHDLERAGTALLPNPHAHFNLGLNPGGFLSSVSLDGHFGSAIDYIANRSGKGEDVTLSFTARPTRHVQLDVNFAGQWLDLEGRRLFTAQVERLKVTWVFDKRTFVRLIGQYVRTDYAPELYPVVVPPTNGSFQASALLGYQLNWSRLPAQLAVGALPRIRRQPRDLGAGRASEIRARRVSQGRVRVPALIERRSRSASSAASEAARRVVIRVLPRSACVFTRVRSRAHAGRSVRPWRAKTRWKRLKSASRSAIVER